MTTYDAYMKGRNDGAEEISSINYRTLNRLLLTLAGVGGGSILGWIKANNRRSILDKIKGTLNNSVNKDALSGMAVGSALGGISGYGAARLIETIQDALSKKRAFTASEQVATSPTIHTAAVKKATASTPTTEFFGQVLTRATPVAGAAPFAHLAGLLTEPDNKNTEAWQSLIPLVADYRTGHRIRSQVETQNKRFGGKGTANAVSEYVGKPLSILTPTALGAIIGALARKNASKRDVINGSVIGAATGAAGGMLARLAGDITAAVNKRRTAEEQAKHDKKIHLENYLIPGMADYNFSKRIGRSQGDRDESSNNKSKKNKNDKKD